MSIHERLLEIFPDSSGIPPQFDLPVPYEQREFLVGGELREWHGSVRSVDSPVCLREGAGLAPRVLGSYPLLTEREALEALEAARRAFDDGQGLWPTLRVEERIAHVESFVVRMQAQRDLVVRLLMWEVGKSAADSCKEFDRTIAYVRDTIEALKELDRTSSRFTIAEEIIAQVRRAPLGVVLCMGPYNYPLNETFTTLIPALIMGNTVVFKPPRRGVLLHRPLLEAFRDCFPPGVVNTVYGEGRTVVGPLMSSGEVSCLAFIGTSRAADILKKQHPKPHRLRCVLGLEAKNPAVILSDADLDLAVRECTLGSLSFNGQRCTALKIIFVPRSIAGDFVERLSRAVETLRFGMPWEDEVRLTPMVSEQVDFVRSLIEDAVARGARVVNEAGGVTHGTFLYPAVLYPVAAGMRVFTEEQFGPIVAVAEYEDVREVVEYMIASNYGQQVSIFGRDPQKIARLIDPVVNLVCRVNLNSQCQRGPDMLPFTGRKDSAEGTLSVSDALRVFSIRTLVAAKGSTLNKQIINDIVRNRRSAFLSDDFIL